VPNDQTVSEAWKPYAVSVATVEQRTGLTFFPLVTADVAGPLKSREP
jgi:DNA/RNA endonuclease G (NUC1)